VLIISGFLFYLLRVQTHFLGEGYNLLTQFEKGIHLVKFTGWGESLMHIKLQSLLGGDNITDSLASFRIISIASGLGWVLFVLYSARRLFERTLYRNLFVLGLITGGYMLLFFGYVEYYSCFGTAVGIFSLTGVMAARRKINRWFILPPLALAIFCHVFGLLLVPAAVYILLSKSKFGARLGRISLPVRWGIFLVVVIIVGVLSYHRYENDLFFQLSIVSLTNSRFTLEGYTLFSPAHLADITNLLLVFVPSLPLFIVLLFHARLKNILKQPVYIFLIILNVCTLAAVFLLDPNYGMPRDWDFFAFAGITLAVLCFYFLLDKGRSLKGGPAVAVLAIGLGLLVLVPRVISQSVPDVIIPHFKTYLKQNRQIAREGRTFLIEYYQRTGDYVSENEQRKIWEESDLEGRQVAIGQSFYEHKSYHEAIKAYKNAMNYNPSHSPAYNLMGSCFFRLQQYDSALYYLKIAEAINPYSPSLLTNLGMAYMLVKDYKKAKKTLLRAIEINDTLLTPRLVLMRLYKSLGEQDKYYQHLKLAGMYKDATADVVRQLADYYREKGEFGQAEIFYRKALDKGLDSSYIFDLQKKYPSLKVF